MPPFNKNLIINGLISPFYQFSKNVPFHNQGSIIRAGGVRKYAAEAIVCLIAFMRTWSPMSFSFMSRLYESLAGPELNSTESEGKKNSKAMLSLCN